MSRNANTAAKLFHRGVLYVMLGLLSYMNRAEAASTGNGYVMVSCAAVGVENIVVVGDGFHLTTVNVGESFSASVQVVAQPGWELLSAASLTLSPGGISVYTVRNIANPEIEESGDIILFKVDVEISGIGEDKEETEGALAGYADCGEGYSNTNCLAAMKSVTIRCLPANRPDDEEITLSFPSGHLLEKVGATYQIANSSYKACEIGSKSFWLHGHTSSTSLCDYEIKAEHSVNGCTDVAKYAVFRLTRIVLADLHGNIDHGTSKEYSVTAYDNFARDITDICSFIWKTIEPSVGVGIRTATRSGTSWSKTWNILDGENSFRPEIASCYAAIFVEATLFGASPLRTSCCFNVNKGTVILESSEYVKTGDSTGAPSKSTIGSPVIVDRTDVVPPPQVTYTVGGEITVQGSVTVTGNAKASVEVPLTSVSAEVSVGIAGQTSVSVKKPWSLSGSVTASNQYAIKIQMYKTTADRNMSWVLYRRKNYNTGFCETWVDGNVVARTDEGAIHIEFVNVLP